MGRMRETAQAMARQMHSNKRTFAVYVVLRLIVVACAASALVFGNYEAFFSLPSHAGAVLGARVR